MRDDVEGLPKGQSFGGEEFNARMLVSRIPAPVLIPGVGLSKCWKKTGRYFCIMQ